MLALKDNGIEKVKLNFEDMWFICHYLVMTKGVQSFIESYIRNEFLTPYCQYIHYILKRAWVNFILYRNLNYKRDYILYFCASTCILWLGQISSFWLRQFKKNNILRYNVDRHITHYNYLWNFSHYSLKIMNL